VPGPEGRMGMPRKLPQDTARYDTDVPRNRAEARKILESSVSPDKRAPGTVYFVDTQRLGYAERAVILIDQLKEIYIDGQA